MGRFVFTRYSFCDARNPMSCSNTVLLVEWISQDGNSLIAFGKPVLPNRRISMDFPCPAGLHRKIALEYASVPSLSTVLLSFRKQHGASKRVVFVNVGLLISFQIPANPRDERSVTSKTWKKKNMTVNGHILQWPAYRSRIAGAPFGKSNFNL